MQVRFGLQVPTPGAYARDLRRLAPPKVKVGSLVFALFSWICHCLSGPDWNRSDAVIDSGPVLAHSDMLPVCQNAAPKVYIICKREE